MRSRIRHDRNRLFGIRRVFFGAGAILVFVAIDGFLEGADPRAHVVRATAIAGLLTAAAMIGAGAFLRERPEHQGRGGRSALAAWRQVLGNPHARLLLGERRREDRHPRDDVDRSARDLRPWDRALHEILPHPGSARGCPQAARCTQDP